MSKINEKRLKLLTPREFVFMRQLKRGLITPLSDDVVACKLASLGLITLRTGKLTDIGAHILWEEELEQRPLLKLIYLIYGPLFCRVS